MPSPRRFSILRFRPEPSLCVLVPTALLFHFQHTRWFDLLSDVRWTVFLFVWLFGAIIWGAKAVVRHADQLAVRLGEPYGTLILTLSVASIEMMTVAQVMLIGAENPTLARDTMFSAVMIVLNGLVGLSLLLGGLRYKEQSYNLRGANSYLSLIVVLSIFGLIMPNFTVSTAGPTFSIPQERFLIAMCTGLYAVFLGIQTTRHRAYFVEEEVAEGDAVEHHLESADGRSVWVHAGMLVTYLVLVVFLAEKLAFVLNYGIEELHAPPAFGALLVAIMVLTPEGLGALKAAINNRLQRAINILLGSVLSTLALTIPAVLAVGIVTGTSVALGLTGVDGVMLALTLGVGMITLSSGRTNILQGAVHLVLFLAYLMLLLHG
jgi:Ca2+:H+ antiporter